MTDLCPPKEMAKWFINRVDRDAGEAITHLKLQKLLYFAQAYYLANFDRELFAEDMQAWTHGPVVPSVWHEYKKYSWESIPPQAQARVSKEIVPYLEAVYANFGKFDAKELERITHEHEPWLRTRDGRRSELKCTDPIDKALIKQFYARRIRDTGART
jgi:uncharacterized phage-associated protein